MAISVGVLLPILLRKTPSEVADIAAQAESVVFGATSSISALNQSATFDADSAAIILQAINQVLAIRAVDPAATAAALPAPSLSHAIRRGSQWLSGP